MKDFSCVADECKGKWLITIVCICVYVQHWHSPQFLVKLWFLSSPPTIFHYQPMLYPKEKFTKWITQKIIKFQKIQNQNVFQEILCNSDFLTNLSPLHTHTPTHTHTHTHTHCLSAVGLFKTSFHRINLKFSSNQKALDIFSSEY